MRQATRNDHERALRDAVSCLVRHLDAPLDIGALADEVNYSRCHFHRVFTGMLGETVGDLSRRLRLERAALALRTSKKPITEIAFEAGYATHEAFIRAFRASYGYKPSAFRRDLAYDGQLPTPNGIHFHGPSALRFVAFGGINMVFEIRQVEPSRAICVPHKGPYYMVGQAFDTFHTLVDPEIGTHLAIFYDDSCMTPAEDLRSFAGAFVPDDYVVSDPRLELIDVPAGRFVVTTHVGPYDGLSTSWGEAYKAVTVHGLQLRDAPNLEVYLDDCSKVPVAEVRTEIWLPII